MLGAHLIKAYSTTQAIVALSSGEAELYSMVKGSASALGVISLMADFGIAINAKVHSDSSAAIGIVNRQGLGKVRHLNVQYLWLQDRVKRRDLTIAKVLGLENPADLMTKYLDNLSIIKHMWRMGLDVSDGRAASAPTLHSLDFYF